MGDRHDLVFLGLQRLLNLGHSNSRTEISTKLINFSTVRLKARPESRLESTNSYKTIANVCAPISEAVAEIPRVEHENVLSRLYQVG